MHKSMRRQSALTRTERVNAIASVLKPVFIIDGAVGLFLT